MDQSSGTLSDVDDDDVSVIEYARYYGLSKDYTSSYPLSPHIVRSILNWEGSDLGLERLPKFRLPSELDLDERWTIDHQSALFLKQIASIEVVPFPEIIRSRIKSFEFQIEPLLLATDPDLEQRRFMRARQSREDKSLQQALPKASWQDDEEASLYWPDPNLPSVLIQQIKQEKLQLDKNDIHFLQQCISITEKPNIQELETPPYKKAQKEYEDARHTSPLLQCSSPFQFSVPDSPVSRMPLATSPIDPVAAEIVRIESTMEVDDEFSLDGLSDISAFDIEAASELCTSSPLKRKQAEDYKMETPLLPALESSSPLKKLKMVTFSDELCTTIPGYAKPFPSEDSNGTDGFCNFFEQVIKPGAEFARLSISNEQLTQADSMLRAEVPAIDQTGPLPPWELFARRQLSCQTELEAQQQLVSMLKRETIRPRDYWPSVGDVDRALSRWRPFDMQMSDLPREKIECSYLGDFSAVEPQDTTSGWKLDGLRILDPCEDDDEEIEATDLSTTLENFDLIEGSHEISSAAQSLAPSAFSVSNSLDRFMQIHTGKKMRIEEPRLQTQAISRNTNKLIVDPAAHAGRHEDLEKVTSSTPVHVPALPTPMPPRTVVLSSTMFARRILVKEIERLNPMAEYIERDFSSAHLLRGLSSQTSEADEADIILSPGHGVMLTTLQKIMQKSLPGEVIRNLIRERVVQLARRYERLIIMVHEDRSSDQHHPLDSRESGELVSLINFCAARSHDIQVMYIPGDEPALATWIVACMIRFGLDDPEVQLLQDETSWELFLRKAGMDAFAAQVVLINLKAPDPMPAHSTDQCYGLPAFLMMDEAERLKMFGTLFGGEKILRKVSMAIDGCWKRLW
ncbi:unnamed protein product [Aureobasidium uvarum]|uniref:Uncharacterized protein n=1 Tax=Aureobasidium uvarum TaxID=2773716 RepID=A0A9N8KC01_9PEZI|nr:unnamed protein product [Aureobasidium uvarum]